MAQNMKGSDKHAHIEVENWKWKPVSELTTPDYNRD